jgi:uracil-DNA glycosylase family 4
MTSKEVRFIELVKRVKACRKCDRMDQSERVLSSACGSLDAAVFFIGEAPGRLGADDSQIPFHGDKSGHNFESLLEQVGLSRYDVFVTNAVLCNPKDELGNNATPTPLEVRNCAPFLAEQIDLVQPSVVATLGSTALKSCDLVAPHHLVMRDAVRTIRPWRNTLLVPIYHPGQRAMMHRSFANQLADYQFIAETVSKSGSGKRQKKSFTKSSEKICGIVDHITHVKPKLSYFALHKLLFLAEVQHLETTGKRLTSAYIVRQKDGPYCVELHPKKLIKGLPDLTFITIRSKLFVVRSAQSSLLGLPDLSQRLTTEELHTIDAMLKKYSHYSDSQLKTVVYLKRPMRELLRKEKSLKSNLFNSPLLGIVKS